MLEELETLRQKYFEKYGIQANTVILGRENFTALLKDKKEFKSLILLEDCDKIDDLTVLQVHNLKMFRVGHIE